MTRSVGNELPAPALALLDGSDPAGRVGVTFLLISGDADDWPHIAMLSVGEIVAVDARTLRAALWVTSTTSANLTRTGRAVLAFVADGRGFNVRMNAAREVDLQLGGDGSLAQFRLEVHEVLEDVADYAELTSGVTFQLRHPAAVLPRWERTIAALRASGAGT